MAEKRTQAPAQQPKWTIDPTVRELQVPDFVGMPYRCTVHFKPVGHDDERPGRVGHLTGAAVRSVAGAVRELVLAEKVENVDEQLRAATRERDILRSRLASAEHGFQARLLEHTGQFVLPEPPELVGLRAQARRAEGVVEDLDIKRRRTPESTQDFRNKLRSLATEGFRTQIAGLRETRAQLLKELSRVAGPVLSQLVDVGLAIEATTSKNIQQDVEELAAAELVEAQRRATLAAPAA